MEQVAHKKTLYYLEQIILKHRAHQSTTNIKPIAGIELLGPFAIVHNRFVSIQCVNNLFADGIDFFFSRRQDARKFVDFVSANIPSRCVLRTAVLVRRKRLESSQVDLLVFCGALAGATWRRSSCRTTATRTRSTTSSPSLWRSCPSAKCALATQPLDL